MYMCSISHLVTQGLPNANVMLRVHSGVVSGAARFESMTSYGVANRVKHPIGVGDVLLELYKYILPCQIWTGTCQYDHMCVSDINAG